VCLCVCLHGHRDADRVNRQCVIRRIEHFARVLSTTAGATFARENSEKGTGDTEQHCCSNKSANNIRYGKSRTRVCIVHDLRRNRCCNSLTRFGHGAAVCANERMRLTSIRHRRRRRRHRRRRRRRRALTQRADLSPRRVSFFFFVFYKHSVPLPLRPFLAIYAAMDRDENDDDNNSNSPVTVRSRRS